MKGVWSGDVDLNDGKLQEMYSVYMDRLRFINNIGLSDRDSRQHLADDMDACVNQMSNDITFISNGKFYLLCTSVICNIELPV